jgi:hypothetical protein
LTSIAEYAAVPLLPLLLLMLMLMQGHQAVLLLLLLPQALTAPLVRWSMC